MLGTKELHARQSGLLRKN